MAMLQRPTDPRELAELDAAFRILSRNDQFLVVMRWLASEQARLDKMNRNAPSKVARRNGGAAEAIEDIQTNMSEALKSGGR